MKTLIELYDERAIENVLGPETFKPETVVYLCPPEVLAESDRLLKRIRGYFAWRRQKIRVELAECSMFDTAQIIAQLEAIGQRCEDCAVDITGGTDAALFAAGCFCQQTGTPALTYSRKEGCFFNISGADYADRIPCSLSYSVADFFRMTGGRLRQGRVDNRLLRQYMPLYQPFFDVYLRHRADWTRAVTYIQRISQGSRDEPVTLTAAGPWRCKGEHGSVVHADPALLRDLEDIGMLQDVEIVPEESVSFTFADAQIRTWLRDVGSVLELYTYKCCADAGCFGDIVSSAIVDWDESDNQHIVSNEIDCVAARGTLPLFISCKACDIRTEALNELAILRDRFGGKGAKAAIVTTERCTAAARHRAAQLGIAVIDREELRSGDVPRRLQVIMKAAQDAD